MTERVQPPPDGRPEELSTEQADAAIRGKRYVVLLVVVAVIGVIVSLAAWSFLEGIHQLQQDEAIASHIEHGAAMPTWKCTMHLYPIDGSAPKVDPDATSWAYRDAKWARVIVGVDPDPANAGAIRQWCVDYWEATHPYSMGGAYVNFIMDEGQEARAGHLPRQLREARSDQSHVRPGELLPRQPEHPTRMTGCRPRVAVSEERPVAMTSNPCFQAR
jgi:hypothetical protein